jgi:hypothetical protein
MIIPTTALVVCSLAVAVAGGPIYSLGARAASELLDPSAYIRVVSRP